MQTTLRVRHAQDYRGRPLLCVANLPGPDPELSPAAARALAAALLRAADDCERADVQRDARRYGPRPAEYPLEV